MTTGLKIGDRWIAGDQMITALVQYKMLDTLIGQVLLDEAIQAIALSHQDVLQWLTGIAQAPIPDDVEGHLAQWCTDNGITPAYFNAVILREWRVEKFKQQYFAHQLESEFLRTRAWFDQVEYSLIQVDEASLAQEIYYQLRDDGLEFADFAAAYSLGPERTTGGRIGPVPLATMPSAILPIIQNGTVGVVQAPMPVGDRYWIVRLEHFMAARLTEATRQELVNRLFNHWLQAKVEALRAIPGAIAMQIDTDSD